MKFAECVPALNIRGKSSLTYRIPDSLAKDIVPGAVVTVPVRGSLSPALVIGISDTSAIPGIKDITSHLFTYPSDYLKLLEFVSKTYFTPLAIVLRMMLPKMPKQIEKLMKNTSNIAQTLVVCPTEYSMNEYVRAHKPNSYKILTAKTKAEDFFGIWSDFAAGSLETLIGTRHIPFVPAAKLTKIVVVDESDSSMNETARPRYNGADVAYELAKIKKCALEIISDAPRVKTYYRFSPQNTAYKPRHTFKFVKTREFQPKSPELDELLEVASPAADILVFYNRVRAKLSLGEVRNMFRDDRIHVATSEVFQSGRMFDVIVVLFADDYYNFQDFLAGELTYQLFAKLKNRLKDNGILFAQASLDIENFLNMCDAGDYQQFYDHEISERKKYDLPPFTRLVSITGGDLSKIKSEVESLGVRVGGSLDTRLIIKPDDVSASRLFPLLSRLEKPYIIDIV